MTKLKLKEYFMETVLENYLNDFSALFKLSKVNETKLFEHFCNYVTIPKIEDNIESIESVNVGDEGNPGIDGIAIIVNDHIVTAKEQVDYFLNALGRLEVEFYIIQAKTSSGFSMSEISSYLSCIKDFFSPTTNYKFNDETLVLHEIKEYIFSKSIKMLDNPILKIIYASTGQWTDDVNLNAAVNTSIKDIKATGIFKDVIFKPYDRDILKKTYRELRNKISRSIKFEKHTILPQVGDVDEAFIGMLPANEFLKLICNDQNDMLRNIFYDNVRDFQGFNTVNTEIQETLSNQDDKDKFSLLNNGVTIVAKNIKKTGFNFSISDYQIVNGCQTSHVLFYNRNQITDDVYLPVKLIVTQNYDLMSKIIRANNRQTTVSNEAFEILSPFHKYLEEFYIAQNTKLNTNLFYERRSNQYEPEKLEKSNYITLSNQTKAVVAMYLNEPHTAKQRYFGELLQQYKSKLFQENDNGYPYFISGYCLNKLEQLFLDKIIDHKFKRFKYHLLMLLRLLPLSNSAVPHFNSKAMEKEGSELIKKLIDDNYFNSTVKKACDVLEGKLDKNDIQFRNAHGSLSFIQGIMPKTVESKTSGIINYYNKDRGFGYLDVNAPLDVFFHITDYHYFFTDEPKIGQRLKFNVVDSEKGLRAINIQDVI